MCLIGFYLITILSEDKTLRSENLALNRALSPGLDGFADFQNFGMVESASSLLSAATGGDTGGTR